MTKPNKKQPNEKSTTGSESEFIKVHPRQKNSSVSKKQIDQIADELKLDSNVFIKNKNKAENFLKKYKVQKSNEPNKESGHEDGSFFGSSTMGIPFKEILQLLKDSYNGKMNDYIQQILDNIESQLDIKKNQNTNKKELHIKLVLAADVIDKYSGLLELVLGQKSLNDEQIKTIQTAKTNTQILTFRLRKIHLMEGIINLEKLLTEKKDEHKKSHCLPFLFGKKTNQKLNEVNMKLRDLAVNSNKFTVHELAGGFYGIRKKARIYLDKKKKYDQALNQFNVVLNKAGFPENNNNKAFLYESYYNNRVKEIEKQQKNMVSESNNTLGK